MKRLAIVLLALSSVSGAGIESRGAIEAVRQETTAPFHATIDPVIDAVWAAYDANAAMDHVTFINQFWRLPGNAGFDASLDRVAERLRTSGVGVHFESPPEPVRAWDHSVGTLALVRPGQPDDVVLSRERERLALCINSFSTAPGGVVAPLVDVGRGDRDEDYTGKTLKGAVVVGDADAGQLWRRAVVTHGAIGVISGALPAYLNADAPGARITARDQWDILQWGSVPYDDARKGFGFKASPRAIARLRGALRRGGDGATTAPVSVRVTIASTFVMKPVRTLVAELPGRLASEERVAIAAHVQEPGANDNASGVATLAELAVSLTAAIKAGKVPPPGRTLTFLFLDEISGSRRWLQTHPEEAKRVKYMFSLDMTGEDVAKTGGSFLIERYPDPGAVWDRPWDPHSEWGRGNVRAEQLRGDLINDLHLAVCLRVARKTGWVVKTNPYEGGSDHTVFGSAGVPSLLNWHFTDRYYHTNFDTPDKTSPAEMKNVGVAVAASAWLLASANDAQASQVLEVVATAGRSRVEQEIASGAKLVEGDKDPAAARAREATIVAAWRKWYAQAARSVRRLVVGPASVSLTAKIESVAASFEPGATAPSPIGLGNGVGLETRVPVVAQADSVGTPFFTCGEDEKPPEVPLRWDTAVLAGDGRLYAPCPGNHTLDHRESRDGVLLANALTSRDAELRRIAVQATGRRAYATAVGSVGVEGRPTVMACKAGAAGTSTPPPRWQAGVLVRALATDASATVRREAAYAIGAALSGSPGEYSVGLPGTPEIFAGARAELEACFTRETNDEVAFTMLETLGRLRYPSDATRDEVEAFLVTQTRKYELTNAFRLLGAAKGLEVLIRQQSKREISGDTRLRLRELTAAGSPGEPIPTIAGRGSMPAESQPEWQARVRRLALLTLQAARDDDVPTLERAALDIDWQVRRLVALRLNMNDAAMTRLAERLALDRDFQVRYDVLAAFGRQATAAKLCAPIARFFDDDAPTVVLRALDVLPASCSDRDAVLPKIVQWADELRADRPETWHLPARALTALARLDPAAARERLSGAMTNTVWQVRAAAAVAAASLSDEAALVTLAGDGEPNVQDAALNGLLRLKSRALVDAAIAALKSSDHQLTHTAATVLRGAPADRRAEASEALLESLRRLTSAFTDTSRDSRVAMIERLGELLAPERAMDVAAFTTDYDPKVRAAATKAFAALTGAADVPPPASAAIKVRYPLQPSTDEMAALPKEARIKLAGGGILFVTLFLDQAPVTIARFTTLARAGRYDGLTFHRVVPNFVIQGGSPGANEYAGASPRYLRDELGTHPHLRGSVGISTRGRDTGDAQIFINLVDLPRLDHDYTVFGRVTMGLDLLDKVLEGAKIESVTVR